MIVLFLIQGQINFKRYNEVLKNAIEQSEFYELINEEIIE